jgi:hypothetical protein
MVMVGETSVMLLARSRPFRRAPTAMFRVSERAVMVSAAGPGTMLLMVMRSAINCGAGSNARDSLPPICTWRPVNDEASVSMVARCAAEETNAGSASSKAARRASASTGMSSSRRLLLLMKPRRSRPRRGFQ